ncbi:MAG: hypothetical protein ACK4MT_01660, partial [Thermaurantiacus tibetensis]
MLKPIRLAFAGPLVAALAACGGATPAGDDLPAGKAPAAGTATPVAGPAPAAPVAVADRPAPLAPPRPAVAIQAPAETP